MVTISCQWTDIELLGLIFFIENLFYTADYLVFAYTYVVGHISGNLFCKSLYRSTKPCHRRGLQDQYTV